MGSHTRQHMVMPPRIFASFIVGHAQLRFRRFTTLFNGPPHPTEPDKETQGRTRGRIPDGVPRRRRCPQGAFAHEPDRVGRLVLVAQGHPFPGTLILYGALRAFRHRPPIPYPRADLLRQRRDALGRRLRRGDPALCAAFPFIGLAVRGRGQGLEPTASIGRNRDERDRAHTRRTCRPALRTVAIQAIGRDRAQR
jgi:hypothetical protein